MTDSAVPTFSVGDALADLGIDFGTEMNLLAESPEAFITPGRTFSLMVDKEVPFIGTIDGNAIECFATLRSARLNRMAILRQTNSMTNASYYVVNGSMRNVVIDVDLILNNQRVPLPEVLRAIVNSGLPEQKQVSQDRFLTICASFGLDFRGGMSFMWQHMGADHSAAIDHLASFKKTGATDVTSGVRTTTNNFEQILSSQTGIPVLKMEVGSSDRTRSATGQGFIDLVDAVVENFRRVTAMRREIRDLDAWLANEANAEAAEEQVRAQKERRDNLGTMVRSYAGNWTGARQRMQRVQGDDGKSILVPIDNIDPTNAPVGRMTVLIDDQPHEYSFWQTAGAKAAATAGTQAEVDLTAAPGGETAENTNSVEDPF